MYEELPELDSDTTANKLFSDSAYANILPLLPSSQPNNLPTLGRDPAENTANSTAYIQTPEQDPTIPQSESAEALSSRSGEDCSAAISPAGTMMRMMPQNSHSLTGGVCVPPADKELPLNCI